jgi:nucleotide-binding universal stress UspA family protein
MTFVQFNFQKAIRDFQSAQQKAALQEILARITGKPNQLLSYEEVAEKLKLQARTERGIKTIPLNAIIGSVSRHTEFTRNFLPLRADDQERWARVKTAFMESNTGLDPIEVYKVGEVYFVVDGNHRVSIARQEGQIDIEARVIELRTDVPITPNIQPDDLIIKAEYAEFLDATRIMDTRPNIDLGMTGCCQYEKLMQQVEVCQQILQQDQKTDVSLQDASTYWYDTMYIPLAEAIRDRGLLRWFPEQTITDLYLWISENRTTLEKDLGWEIQSDIAATDLILKKGAQSETGSWRKARIVSRYTDHLFLDILVPLSGDADSWDSLEQAIILAQREGSNIHGLHIVNSMEKMGEATLPAIQAQFEQRCAAANITGSLVTEFGEVTRKISDRATMTDLIVLKITHPPQGGLSTLKSPFRSILAHSSRPLLCVPGQASHFRRALLAYDGSTHSKEALFMATYLAETWQTELTVVTALKGARQKTDVQDHVQRYLDIHEVQAKYIVTKFESMNFLNTTAEELQVDLILMGGDQSSPLQNVISGNLLDYTLRESKVPTFVCH